ncbi:MAG: hypothetical protein M3Y58_10745, partial [Chloroflexota bacterium]|nr:hypothetical protein [Chloroflexota bacterium]
MRRRFTLLAAFVLCLMPLATPVRAASAFANPAFETQWKQGEALAPNFWGPLANATDGITEEYLYSGTNKSRTVQYFDKGRMELYGGVTNMPGVQVTNGLLATEMVKGQIQIADDQFLPQPSPDIAIAGDPGGSAATYADLGTKAAGLLAPAGSTIGHVSNATIQPSGDLGSSALPPIPQTTITVYDDATKHNVPGAFAQYRDRAGLSSIGYALSEPFHATVKIAGASRFVMIQVFERRVLTYTDTNPDPYKVEMGNIGQHYYKWRYASSAPVPAMGNAPATGPSAPPATNQMDPFGPAAPLTQTYMDPQGRFTLQYPAGWHVDATLGMRHAVGLTGPFTTLEMTLDIIGQAPTLGDEIDAFKAGWTAQGVGATFSQEAIRDGQIGGEPAKFYTAILAYTRDGQPVTLNVLFADAFHGSDAYA